MKTTKNCTETCKEGDDEQNMRTIVVTGSASGIGLATAKLLRNKGHRVIGVDLHNAEVTTDLSTSVGCQSMVDAVKEMSPNGVDAVIANAGVNAPDALCYAVNYHGAIRTLEGLQPLLTKSRAPRAVVTASIAASNQADHALLLELEEGRPLLRAISRAWFI